MHRPRYVLSAPKPPFQCSSPANARLEPGSLKANRDHSILVDRVRREAGNRERTLLASSWRWSSSDSPTSSPDASAMLDGNQRQLKFRNPGNQDPNI